MKTWINKHKLYEKTSIQSNILNPVIHIHADILHGPFYLKTQSWAVGWCAEFIRAVFYLNLLQYKFNN